VKEELKHYEKLYVSGRLDRREFMRRMTALGVASGTLATMLGATVNAAAATPKRGGRLRLGWYTHSANDTLDPTRITTTLDYHRIWMTNSTLVRYSRNFEAQPELAESWEPSPDAKVWHFKLRKGVEFHDGKTLDADDVVYSMNRHLGPDSVSKGKSLVSMVTEWKKIDQHTVKAIMDSPNADLPAALGTFHFKIVENGAEGEYFRKPNGTGPFKSQEFNPGIRALGVRNENYWVDGRPYLDELETFAITDPSARTNAAIAGDVDVAGAPDPNAFKLIEESENVDLLSIPSANLTGIVCMVDRSPGNNPDFLLGLKYLQNRERIVRTLMKGHAIVGNDHPISPAYPDHCSELEIREFDPDKGKFHLQKSGISEATVLAGEVRPGVTDFCLMLQAEARKVGFTLNVKKVPTDGYWGTVWMNTPVCATGWNMRPSANLMLTLAYKSDAAWNESRWNNPRFDQLLLESRAEKDAVKRHEMYCDMQRLIRDEGGQLIPCHINYVDAVSKKVRGLGAVPLSNGSGCEWPEFAWLDT
jgi:peptide/nickel transport system substrate-binding protein